MSVTIRLYGVRLAQCSYIDDFVVDLVIHGCSLYGSTTFRMSTRRLPVILCFLVSSDCIEIVIFLLLSLYLPGICNIHVKYIHLGTIPMG